MKNDRYKVLIIDDESCCIESLRNSTNQFPQLDIVGIANSSLVGKSIIMEQKPDLVFLGIELPDQTGLELLNELHERITWPMYVVFYTMVEKYMLDALRASAFDYLLKPHKEDDFNFVVNRFFTRVSKNRTNHTFRNDQIKLNTSQRFLIPNITGYQMLRKEQIGYFEYIKDKKQWMVTLSDLTKLQLKRNTTAEDILNYATSFIQISQGYIINLDYLSAINGKHCQLLPPFHVETTLIISRTFLKILQEKLETI